MRPTWSTEVNLAVGMLLQRDIDGVALAYRQFTRLGGELAIGTNTAGVDDGVEDLVAALVGDQRFDLRMPPHPTRGAHVLSAIHHQAREFLGIKDPVQNILVLAFARLARAGHLPHQHDPFAVFPVRQLERSG
jgi:hypothetical protein